MLTQPSAVQHEQWVLLKILLFVVVVVVVVVVVAVAVAVAVVVVVVVVVVATKQSSPPLLVTPVKQADYVW